MQEESKQELVSKYFGIISEQENPEEVQNSPEYLSLKAKLDLFLKEATYTFSEEERKKIWCPAVDVWYEAMGSTRNFFLKCLELEYFDACDWVSRVSGNRPYVDYALLHSKWNVRQIQYMFRTSILKDYNIEDIAMEAVNKGNVPLLKYMITEKKANIAKEVIPGRYILLADKNIEAVRYLFSEGIISDIEKVLWDELSVPVLEFLREHGKNLQEIPSREVYSVLYQGKMDILKYLRKCGYNLQDILRDAVNSGYSQAVSWLLSKEGGCVAYLQHIREAARNFDIVMLRTLLRFTAGPVDLNFYTSSCITNKKCVMLRFLLSERECDPHHRDNLLFKEAIQISNIEALKVLVEFSDPLKLDSSLIDMAKEKGDTQVVNYLASIRYISKSQHSAVCGREFGCS